MVKKTFAHESVWIGLSVGGALAIVIGVLWFIFTVSGTLLTEEAPWLAAVVMIVIGMLFVIVGDTVLMKKELEK
jgi:uncharacterized membrane protein